MKLLQLTFYGCLAFGIGGCAAIKETMGNIIVYDDGSSSSSRSDSQRIEVEGRAAPQRRWQTIEARFNTDIDTAYGRVRREFNYLTTEERLARTPGVYGDTQLLRASGFRHEASPGSSYTLQDQVRHPRGGERQTIRVELYKDGRATHVVVKTTRIPVSDAMARVRSVLGS